ncbi:ABC transporter substrate-binding protein [Kaistia dalseonensis]|uniref:Branched-chain amino acid transport system substrate-binding protein n=1 Tax=Kaistia dalseonensis TaxID=410840 RepID=A0ABU0H9R9_9HYPH|nr:ABC transporter substrate-binding protein [Kaistia dalseonensis]MCX5495613.1 ABC transporter substrate-binding protein [Kaistia dalseonensis]MDQ0438206.1 branched-chain amino acid transport system substrate-binding protein [Kaistia dalseonensis]
MTSIKSGGLVANRRQIIRGLAAAGAASAVGMPYIARAQGKDTIRIGYIDQFTGIRSNFAETAPWVLDQIEAKLANGIEIGGRSYGVEILRRDSQSDPNRMGSLGNELVLRENVDLLLIADGLAAPALEICDQNGTPAISTILQWEPFYASRGSSPDKGYPWSFLFFWSGADIIKNYVGMWEASGIDKVVGTLYEDNDFGRGFSGGMTEALKTANFKEVQGGLFKEQVDDFSNQVAAFRDGGAKIVTGLVFPQHFATFYGQALQSGLELEAATIAAAFVFPSGVEVLGDRGAGMSTEVWFNRQLPFKSSITGDTADAFCSAYEQSTGKQWAQPMGYEHAIWEVALAALKASGDPKNREAVRDSIAGLELETIIGKVDFKNSPMKSVANTWVTMGQWHRNPAGSKFPYELYVTNNVTAPQVPIQKAFLPLSSFR